MGDHDQREHRRKRHNKGYRAKEKDDGNPFPLSKKAPSILTKSSAEKSAAQGKSTESSLQVPNQPPQPTIILKARDTSSPSLRNKAENVNGPNHTIPKAGSTANIQSLLAPYPQMNSAAVKLIDENLEFHTGSLQSFLTEQTDFTVIGVIGLQGSGKSTILSHLVSNTDCSIFPVQSDANMLECCHCTTGLDIYVSNNRLILLDTQPILSPSLMDISVMQDWFIDPNVVRFIQSTEMLKPSNLTNRPEECYEYFPEGVFIHNKVPACDFLKHNIGEMQEFYSNSFAKSKLFIHTGKNMECEGNPLDSEISLCNVYQVPEIEDSANFSRVMSSLRKQLSGTSRRNFTINTLSEKNWLLYAAKIWDHIRKSSYFLEYNRYLP